ncbi:MAG: putative lipid II flippase FtsW [Oscillospiraceae bacterium]|nr:putative lipid II flippase FtsW [Oscillospiraceae bacterium]
MSDNRRPKNDSASSIRLQPRSEKYRSQRAAQSAAVRGAVPDAGGAAAIQAAPVKQKAKKKTWVRSGFDYPLFTIVTVLLAFGIIMMFSASYANAFAEFGDSMYYLKRQALFAIGGLIMMMMLSGIDYHIFRSKTIVYAIGFVSIGLMVAVKLFGTTQGGSERWLQIGELTFQPSEILKFAVIVFFAYFAEKRFEQLREFKKGFLPLAIILATSCGLLMMQPHLSGTIIVFSIGFSMMFVAGVNLKHLFLMLGGLVLLLVIAISVLNAMGIDYFSDRLLSFTDPEADISDKTFQTYQSLVTIGSGGLFGLGFGNSRQKYGYMPMSRNDFVFSIICEELGFVGAVLVILLFVIFVWRGFYVCSKARDKFGMMLAFGITFQIGLQALLNIAVVTNSIPNTGISLPFFSYGGTALVMQLAEMGILLSVSRKAELE